MIVSGSVIALAALGLICVNLYVQSQATQARIQQELRQRLGTPLNIQRISVTPWGGLRLSGITMGQVEPGSGDEFLEAKSFGLRIRFLSLFSHRLVIKDVSLVDPKVVWRQNPEGKWRLPGARDDRAEIFEANKTDLRRAAPESVSDAAASGTGKDGAFLRGNMKVKPLLSRSFAGACDGVNSVFWPGGTLVQHSKGSVFRQFAWIDLLESVWCKKSRCATDFFRALSITFALRPKRG